MIRGPFSTSHELCTLFVLFAVVWYHLVLPKSRPRQQRPSDRCRWDINPTRKCPIISIIFYALSGDVRYQLTTSPFRLMGLHRIIIIESEIWVINNCLGLGKETSACALCITVLLYAKHRWYDSTLNNYSVSETDLVNDSQWYRQEWWSKLYVVYVLIF